ncbi:MAG: hypothetical protein WAK61_20160 [Leclercia sp.]
MLNSMAINALHRMLTAVLALLVVGFGVYQYYATQPPDDDLFSQQQITPDVYLYVTKYKGGALRFLIFSVTIWTQNSEVTFLLIWHRVHPF